MEPTATNDNDKSNQVGGWWAASSDADHEQISLYEVVGGGESLLDTMTVTLEDFPTLEDFKIEVKRLFGGGIYVAVVRGMVGQFAKRPRFAISGRPIREKMEEAKPAQTGLEIILAQMAEDRRRSDERFAQLLAREPEKQPDTLELFDKVAGILQKTAAPVQEKSQSLMERAMEKKFIEFMEEGLGGSGKADESLMPMLTELVGGIREVMADGEKTKRLQIAADAKREGLVNQPALEEAQAAPAVSGDGSLMGLLGQLVEAAEQKADVKDIARQVFESAARKPQTLENLKALLDREDALQTLASFNSKVPEHYDWFEALAIEILDLMESAGNGNAELGGSPAAEPAQKPEIEHSGRGRGDKANAVANARPRTPRKAATGNKSAGAVVSG